MHWHYTATLASTLLSIDRSVCHSCCFQPLLNLWPYNAPSKLQYTVFQLPSLQHLDMVAVTSQERSDAAERFAHKNVISVPSLAPTGTASSMAQPSTGITAADSNLQPTSVAVFHTMPSDTASTQQQSVGSAVSGVVATDVASQQGALRDSVQPVANAALTPAAAHPPALASNVTGPVVFAAGASGGAGNTDMISRLLAVGQAGIYLYSSRYRSSVCCACDL